MPPSLDQGAGGLVASAGSLRGQGHSRGVGYGFCPTSWSRVDEVV